jgi:AcrR family transcriptional regulator
MNPKITSEEEILETCRLIVSKEGMNALNMRHVAEMQGIALGSLYHYFPSKDVNDVTSAVESVWLDIFAFKREDHPHAAAASVSYVEMALPSCPAK